MKLNDYLFNLKKEIKCNTFVDKKIVYKLIDIYNEKEAELNKMYGNKIKKTLDIVLDFFKQFNIQYYNIINNGLNNGKIEFNNEKSYMNEDENILYIKLNNNDGDVFMLVHEFAHFIDYNSSPKIIPNQYWFLKECFAFYMEKKFEIYLGDNYKELISARSNNRRYFEYYMVKAVENQLLLEDEFLKTGKIDLNEQNKKRIESIIKYDINCEIKNYLISYPIANIISSLLVEEEFNLNNFVTECININLYKTLGLLNKCK